MGGLFSSTRFLNLWLIEAFLSFFLSNLIEAFLMRKLELVSEINEVLDLCWKDSKSGLVKGDHEIVEEKADSDKNVT